MTQREQFEAWHKHEYGFTFSECRDSSDRFEFTSRRQAWNAAWQAAQSAKDAEAAELRENLAKCREFIQALEKWENSDIHIDISDIVHIWHEFKFAKEACGL